jgi:hypothetical protein
LAAKSRFGAASLHEKMRRFDSPPLVCGPIP